MKIEQIQWCVKFSLLFKAPVCGFVKLLSVQKFQIKSLLRLIKCLKWKPFNGDIYRPHPKDGRGAVFTGVCLFTEGYPISIPWYLIHWFHVLSGGLPQSHAEYSLPGLDGVPPVQDCMWYPSSKTGWGTPSLDRDGVPLAKTGPHQDSTVCTCYAVI